MMKKTIITVMAVVFAATAIAQPKPDDGKPREERKPDKVRVTPYGFVRNYFTYDNRNMYTVIGGEYDMLPYDRNMSDDVDLNDFANAKFLALTTRVGLRLDGPEVWGAKSSGRIEGDFGGFGTNNTVLRIRLAYVKLDWQHRNQSHSELLMGQDWHPMSGSIMPDALGMAAGAPFRPHSRTPQVRYAYTLHNGIGVTAAALYQLQYMYNGPDNNVLRTSTNATSFANNAVVPEMFVGFSYKGEHVYTQVGVNVQSLRPRYFGTAINGTDTSTVRVDEWLTTFTPTCYFQYLDGKFGIKARTLLAQNTSHLNQLNGYAVTDFDPATGVATYAPMRATISYLDFSYGKKYKVNLFLGYMKNLGAASDLYDFSGSGAGDFQIYMKGKYGFTHLNTVWRVAPAISYNLKHYNFGLEYEVTGATFGDWASNGAILDNDNLHGVVNHRVCVLVKYNF